MRRHLSICMLAYFFALSAGAQQVWRIELTGPITPASEEFVVGAIAQANSAGTPLIFMRIDTPGGLVSSVEGIQRAIIQSKAPVAAWVGPVNARATSGGALVALSCDLLAMAPGTTIGSAHPVFMPLIPMPTSPQPNKPDGEDKEQKPAQDGIMMEKVLNDLSAHARSLAENRGRNAAAFEKMLRESTSYTEAEALAEKVSELTARNEEEVFAHLRATPLKRFDGSETRVQLPEAVTFRDAKPTLRQRLLIFVADPNLAFVLLLLGILGLYAEFKAPGLIFPGVLGGICVLLFLLSTTILPVNVVGVLLILLGVAFLLLELKIASYGILGAGGVISLLIGGLTLYRGSPVPELKVSLAILIPVVLAFSAILLFMVTLAVRAFKNPVMTGDQGLSGQAGTVSAALMPGGKGKVFVFGEYWDATAEEELPVGTEVVVVARRGMVLLVKASAKGGV